MKKNIVHIFVMLFAVAALSSCTTYNKTLREPNVLVELEKADFSLSGQVSAEASSTKILMIDFERLFTKKNGYITGGAASSGISLASIPVIGSALSGIDPTANYALYDLMEGNPGYDVVFYPRYDTKISRPFLGIGFIVKTTTVKATARLGKLN